MKILTPTKLGEGYTRTTGNDSHSNSHDNIDPKANERSHGYWQQCCGYDGRRMSHVTDARNSV